MEKMIKVRLFPYYEEGPILGTTGTGLFERNAFFGEVHDIPREEDIAKGEKHDAFFSDEERKLIDQGKYRGPGYEQLRGNATAALATPDAGFANDASAGMAFSAADASVEEIAEHIKSNRLSVPNTVALMGDDPVIAERVLDAETMVAVGNNADARKGVDDGAQAIINAGMTTPEDDDTSTGGGSGLSETKPTAAQLAKQIKEEALNVEKTVALAGNDAELAKRVLAAEERVADQEDRQIRVGVERGVQAIIERANQ